MPPILVEDVIEATHTDDPTNSDPQPSELPSTSTTVDGTVEQRRVEAALEVYVRRLRRSVRLERQCISPFQVENLYKNSALSTDQKALYYYVVLLTDPSRFPRDEVLFKCISQGNRVALDRAVLADKMVRRPCERVGGSRSIRNNHDPRE